MTVAIYPGRFDPVTMGHIDIVKRGASLFEKLIVSVFEVPESNTMFSTEERMALLSDAIGGIEGVEVRSFNGLVVDWAHKVGATAIVRGIRMNADFEYEFEMALMNKRMYPEIETLFMMTSQQFFYVSSSRLKELVRFGANVGDFVPPIVAKKLEEKLGGRS